MRIYVKKFGKGRVVVYKESLKDSIISDGISAIVIVLLFGIDFLFSYFIEHSFVIDIAVFILFFGYVQSFSGMKYKITDINKIGEEVESILNNEK